MEDPVMCARSCPVTSSQAIASCSRRDLSVSSPRVKPSLIKVWSSQAKSCRAALPVQAAAFHLGRGGPFEDE